MPPNPTLETLGEMLVGVFHKKLKNPEDISWQEMKLIKDTLAEAGIRLNGTHKATQDLKAAFEAAEEHLKFPQTLEDSDGVPEDPHAAEA